MNTVIRQDAKAIGQNGIMTEFEGTSILVTGGTGLIGSTLVMGLLEAKNIDVYVLARSIGKAKNIFCDYLENKKLHFIIQDISQPIPFDLSVDYIIHTASPTSSKYFVDHPVETIHTSIQGTDNVLKFAKEHSIKSLVYLSSLEVYGVTDPMLDSVKELDYGYLDPFKVRSSYSEGKRMVECLCASYYSEYSVPIRVARLAQTFGPGVSYEDGRVFADFARSCIEKRDIVLHTEGKTVRNYCYTKDAAIAILYILAHGQNGEAYNVANPDTAISIYDMACLLHHLYPDSQVKVMIDGKERGYNPDVIIRLNVDKLNALGYRPSTSLEQMYNRLIESMKEGKIK
ncbi:NAD-dependent epimerase/dehydratase family protein [Absicoccus porci]|uniref:NAD-dependent epimerase/dehydratase family protein n=1 Tax=Absicoccus porci TaxID=2486576 RepID=A0A3N0I302_9FIRM|nr:NAD-dependent epimerase/dehydratase family protein [Absicoccus porci]RNM31391.1 NAD-dependent epimerase/dehydratase family protein [Absicoccus porci]